MNLHILSLCVIFLFASTDFTTTAQVQETPFDQNYFSLWGGDHVTVLDQGKEVQIKIDEHSGGGTRSKQPYTFGIFQQRIKKPKLDFGIVTTIYLTSEADGGGSSNGAHSELDFEFLGHNGPPYILSTNIFLEDAGHREQQFKLWFDPTLDFHDYKIVWNQYQIAFYVDDIPIRVLKNFMKFGVKYPVEPMYVHTSLWNSTEWIGPVNWKLGPFYANFRDFAIDGCLDSATNCESSNYNWNAGKYRQLDREQQKRYETVRRKVMTHDYCKGKDSNTTFPECKFIV